MMNLSQNILLQCPHGVGSSAGVVWYWHKSNCAFWGPGATILAIKQLLIMLGENIYTLHANTCMVCIIALLHISLNDPYTKEH